MNTIQLGHSSLRVTPVCMGTMTFGEQVDQPLAHAILDRAVEMGINFIDTAEMYSVPTRAETYGATETILGNWFAARPGMRGRVVLATKAAGPARGTPWIRGGSIDVTQQDLIDSCDKSLKRLKTDVIDLYQIHWPLRHVPMFGASYFDPGKERQVLSIHEQLEALARLVKAGKVRAIGLSNETPYGVHEFVRVAEQHGLPRVATVQNVYNLVARGVDNGLDETMHHLQVSLLAYSPLAFGLLTGKYDKSGLVAPDAPQAARLTRYEKSRQQRWGRPEALDGARRYNAMAREHGLTPVQLALAFCYQRWSVASTIIGVTSLAQLEENMAAREVQLAPEVIAKIDALRWVMRDPAN
ncbi:MAG: aldo/keto reductase [Burkholderiaceae bacterium]|nr:aldo/keto reductase [Burkholderiaceae bacterium]